MALPVLHRKARRTTDAIERRSTASQGVPAVGSPLAEFNDLYERMGALLAQTFGDAFGSVDAWRPATDVEETAEAYVIELELPGVRREDVSVEFGGGELAVTGEVKERERVGFLRSRTRPVGRFDYRVSLPADVEEDQVTASLSDGVLTVRVPKSEKARPRRIPISTA